MLRFWPAAALYLKTDAPDREGRGFNSFQDDARLQRPVQQAAGQVVHALPVLGRLLVGPGFVEVQAAFLLSVMPAVGGYGQGQSQLSRPEGSAQEHQYFHFGHCVPLRRFFISPGLAGRRLWRFGAAAASGTVPGTPLRSGAPAPAAFMTAPVVGLGTFPGR